jgi:hypothetical protein
LFFSIQIESEQNNDNNEDIERQKRQILTKRLSNTLTFNSKINKIEEDLELKYSMNFAIVFEF